MRASKAAIAIDPRSFGRRICVHEAVPVAEARLSEEVRLFATTFLAGFLFVSILLA